MKRVTQSKAPVAAMVMAASWLVFGGCDASAGECSRVCDKYQDCVNPDYDVLACGERCEANADRVDLGERSDACESCIDDKSCGESAPDCDDECAGIVP